MVDAMAGVDHAPGAARRRRERRLRAYLRYTRMTVAMALAEATHHTAPRGQKTARAREEEREVHYTAAFRTTVPPPEPELFDLFEEPSGGRPSLLLDLRKGMDDGWWWRPSAASRRTRLSVVIMRHHPVHGCFWKNSGLHARAVRTWKSGAFFRRGLVSDSYLFSVRVLPCGVRKNGSSGR